MFIWQIFQTNFYIVLILQSVGQNLKLQLADYADILYTQSLLIEGLPVDDPAAYANKICDLLAK